MTARDSTTADERHLDAYLRELLDPARARHGGEDAMLLGRYEPVAIVGAGVRFPGGCDSLDDFDAFLRDGRSGIVPLPEDRWDPAAFTADDPADPETKGKIRTAGGGYLDRIDLFDAPFFNISAKEAQYVDPQQRMVLETAWQALEHAGIDAAGTRRGNGGVYIGASSIDYAMELDALPYEELDGHLAAGITMFPLSGRLSYFLGWRGPSVSVDTACSSSLAALHMAVQGLRARETDIALCGGVNALHHPRISVMFSHANMLSPDGLCKTFDEAADGYVRAEGCGIVVLKRLTDAVRDGDTVLALVRGTAVGQDGDSAGLTVPNGAAQETVMRNALEAALLAPADIQYVEAHGTGTPLGDPIELGAINDACAQGHDAGNPLLVGSVKTNLGHMEPASGVVGLLKAALQIRSGTVYPHLHLAKPSGRIPWDVYPVRVPTRCTPYPPGTRRALVNSFGFAGTIGAVVLEEPPWACRTDNAPAAPRVFTLSAKSAPALRGQLESYRAFLDGKGRRDGNGDRDGDGIDLDSLCYTTHLGRSHFPHRLAAPVEDADALRALLDGALAREDSAAPPGIRKTAFMFTGQGSQYPGMGAALFARFPAFRAAVEECDRLFAPRLGRSVRDLVVDRETPEDDLGRTEFTQPALFTLEFALARLWRSWGARPNALIGHSVGEVTAAADAGLLSLPDAVTLVAARARLMQSVSAAGGMAAVAASEERVGPLVADLPGLALAAVNAPDQCVISGDVHVLDKVADELGRSGVRVDRLAVSHAFHSPLMAGASDELRDVLAGMAFHDPHTTVISNLSGRPARKGEMATADYWARHISEPVRFMDGVRSIARRGRHAFVEIGPSGALTALARRCVPAAEHRWLPSLRGRAGDGGALVSALAGYYEAGLTVDWAGFHGTRSARKTALPTYAFQRARHWLPVPRPGSAAARTGTDPACHPLLGAERASDGTEETADRVREFATSCTPGSVPALEALRTPSGPALPLAATVDLLLALQDTVYGHTRATVSQLRAHGREAALSGGPDGTFEFRTRLTPVPGTGNGAGGARVEVLSARDGTETAHVTALLQEDGPYPAATAAARKLRSVAGQLGTPVETVSHEDIYRDMESAGRAYEPRFRTLLRAERHPDGMLSGEVTVDGPGRPLEQLPPEVLEGALHTLSVADHDAPALAPARIGALRLCRKPRASRLRVLARTAPASDDAAACRRTADMLLLDDGQVVAELAGVELERMQDPASARHFLHRPCWVRRSGRPRGTPHPARHVAALCRTEERAKALESLAEAGSAADAVDTADAGDAGDAAGGGIGITAVSSPDALRDLLQDAPVTDVCWFWQSAGAPVTAASLRAECEANYRHLLGVLPAMTDGGARTPRLWLVTERAQRVPGDEAEPGRGLAATTLWGFGHTLLNEYPQLRATLVDVPDDGGLPDLVSELRTADDGDFQVARRAGQRYVRRLLPGDPYPPDGPFELRAYPEGPAAGDGEAGPPSQDPGSPSGDPAFQVSAVPCEAPPAPGPGEVTVRVHAVGLSADDVRRGAEAEGAALGSAASGTVVAAGAEAGFAPGARVVTRDQGLARRTVTLPASTCTPAPPDVPPATAAARQAEPAGGSTAPSALHPPVYAPEEAGEALSLLARGALAGAPAVRVADERDRQEPGDARAPVPVRPDRVYLVTGGLGGLGLVTARKLVEWGARRLALLSRSGEPSPEAASVLSELSGRADVRLLRGDVSSPEDVARVTAELLEDERPVGGIVHAAGSVGKSLISRMRWEDIDEQFQAKVYGGWLLHEAAASFTQLDFFVAYSSIASVVGGATQAHYAGASAFLDALVEWRAAQGLPARAANWGAWAGVGMSARLDSELSAEIQRGGITFFSPSRGLRALEHLWRSSAPRLVVGDVDWPRFTAAAPVEDALYARLPRRAETAVEQSHDVDVESLLALPGPERSAAIEGLVAETVSAALHMPRGEELDHGAEFTSLGLDSMTGMEVKSAMEKTFRLTLPASLIFDHPSVRRLGRFLEEQVASREAA
ncbi:type I polyketide synthase [Streptomyces iconiensis]|uniref:SDR family NAD(P)-dependent oxidoreductase n=1 Tax=Streptomyces iconiensis TaxID=1384038 RepID=A0ABT7A4Q9_9ACTN|nr:type I polyketide synthase [Streptomyces iconiensis]MDJ1135791.1 SDR family NAD(P)-dependent oxidoreductase [Streptomyces iconiensis]